MLWFELNNVTASVQVKLMASSFGRIRPTLQKIKLDLGTSAIVSESTVHQWLINQFITPCRYFFENSIVLFGAGVINPHLGYMVDEYLQN